MNHIFGEDYFIRKKVMHWGGGEALWVFGDRLDGKNGCRFVSKWISL
jgi:hypothetical protein